MVNKPITVGVLALQGGVVEHIHLLRKASAHIPSAGNLQFTFNEVRTPPQLAQCDALILPGGESTTMAIVARRLGLLEPLRDFVKYGPYLPITYSTPLRLSLLAAVEHNADLRGTTGSSTNRSGVPAPGWSC